MIKLQYLGDKYLFQNGVEYNTTKSLCMVFKPRGFYFEGPDVYMNLNNLAYVKEAKYKTSIFAT